MKNFRTNFNVMDSHQAKYDAIIQKVIEKSVPINEIIGHLHKNRLKFSDFKNNPKHNCTIDFKDPKVNLNKHSQVKEPLKLIDQLFHCLE